AYSMPDRMPSFSPQPVFRNVFDSPLDTTLALSNIVSIVHTRVCDVHNRKTMLEQDILGLQEIAALAKVTRAAVANWRTRFKDFPKPIAQLAAGPVFRRDQVMAWLKRK